jgi:hypothetical protein
MTDVIETVVETVIEKDELTLVTEKLAKAEAERDNYKNVALKRLGKLPGDAEFVAGEETELSVQEQVRLALLDREVEITKNEERQAKEKLIKENTELRLALKNQPNQTLGGTGSGATVEVKDNTFTEAQLADLRARATRLNADPEKFIERAKQNLKNRS